MSRLSDCLKCSNCSFSLTLCVRLRTGRQPWVTKSFHVQMLILRGTFNAGIIGLSMCVLIMDWFKCRSGWWSDVTLQLESSTLLAKDQSNEEAYYSIFWGHLAYFGSFYSEIIYFAIINLILHETSSGSNTVPRLYKRKHHLFIHFPLYLKLIRNVFSFI